MFPVDCSNPTWFESLVVKHGIDTALEIWTHRNTLWFQQHPNTEPTPDEIRDLIEHEWWDLGCPTYDEWKKI